MKKLALLTVAVSLCSSFSMAKDLSWSDIAKFSMKNDSSFNIESRTVEYMQVFEEAKYRQFKDDEFEFNDKKIETAEKLKKVLSEINNDAEFDLNIAFNFGQYDFAAGAYPVTVADYNGTGDFPSPVPTGIYFGIQGQGKNLLIGNDAFFPFNYNLKITNGDAIKPILMDKEAAKAFLQSRKKDSYVDRNLPATITVKLKSVRAREEGENLFNNGKIAEAEIQKITYYKDVSMKKALATQDLTQK